MNRIEEVKPMLRLAAYGFLALALLYGAAYCKGRTAQQESALDEARKDAKQAVEQAKADDLRLRHTFDARRQEMAVEINRLNDQVQRLTEEKSQACGQAETVRAGGRQGPCGPSARATARQPDAGP